MIKRLQCRAVPLGLLVSLLVPHSTRAIEQDVSLTKPSAYLRVEQELLSVNDVQGSGNPQKLTPGQKDLTVLRLFAFGEQLRGIQPMPSVIDTDPIREDLEYFNRANFFSKINITRTVFGKAVIARQAAEPTSDITELHRRQTLVKYFLEHEELFNAFDTLLLEIKKHEQIILSFFSEYTDHIQSSFRSLYFAKEFEQWLEPIAPGLGQGMNKSPKLLWVTEIFQKCMFPLTIAGWYFTWKNLTNSELRDNSLITIQPAKLLAGWGGAGALAYLYFDKPDAFAVASALATVAGGAYAIKRGHDFIKDNGLGGRVTKALSGLKNPSMNGAKNFISTVHKRYTELNSFQSGIVLPLTILEQLNGFRNWYKTELALQQNLMKLAHVVDYIKTLSVLTHKLNLGTYMPEVQALVARFNDSAVNSTDMNKLLAALKSKTFSGKPSIFSNLGRIAFTNRLMMDTRIEWLDIFESIGHLDAYLSAARLVKKFKEERVHYCFIDFVERDKPYLSLTNFWNPLLDHQKVVTNSFELGHDVRNVILTGPNSGGKSANIRGIALAVVFGHVFGIAPADACTMTPFASIRTYMHVQDDTQHGLSTYVAQLMRSKEIFKAVTSLAPNQFSLTITDELFRGTSNGQSEVHALQYIKSLAEVENSLSIHATHLHSLIDLEQQMPDKFKNYKVDIAKLSDGTLQRHYKLEPGWSMQKVGDEILHEQGAEFIDGIFHFASPTA
jgi:hypothetical protein